MKKSISVIILFLFIIGCEQNEPGWGKEQVYKVERLTVPIGNGDSGFSEMAPSQTGVTAGNWIGEQEILENQHLMHGSGVALGDVNGDGRIDIYIPRIREHNVLYINKGDWQFEDATTTAGVACKDRYSTGATFADVDGDRDLDLIVTALGGPNSLFINNGDGVFTENILPSFLDRPGSTSSALADVDNDGDLDLYITNYKRLAMRDSLPPPVISFDNTLMELTNNRWIVMPPFNKEYETEVRNNILLRFEMAEVDQFYLNDGKGNFKLIDITQSHFTDENGQSIEEHLRDWGLMAQFRDINNDTHPDIYICNDFESPDRAWINNGDGTFRALPKLALRHTSNSSMAVDFSDLNNDGLQDFFVTDMMSQSHIRQKTQMGTMAPTPLSIGDIDDRPQYMHNTLFLNRGDNTFSEISQFSNTQASEWSWASMFIDVDLDGFEDVLITTGHMYDVQDSDSNQKQKEALAHVRSFDQFKRMMFNYPTLELKNIAFRNRGNLKFETIPNGWGLGLDKDISHGMASADLDNDGDLDIVINRLNQNLGLFRNNTSAKRLAIRLVGNRPNSQAIGAKIILNGGPVRQSREVISGGHYLSANDPLQVFAASDQSMAVEIRWRDGTMTTLDSMKADNLYTIRQINSVPIPVDEKLVEPIFTDVSELLDHSHHEDPFDDFSNQSLLPNRFSQLGPGVAWMDVDEDGDEDIFISGGRGGSFDHFENKDGHSFVPFSIVKNLDQDFTALLSTVDGDGNHGVMAAKTNFESDKPVASFISTYSRKAKGEFESLPHMAGPMSQADVDGDGDLDVFVGGRIIPNQYPKPASSILYINQNGKLVASSNNSSLFSEIGLVSGSVFSDIDNDGDPDLILAMEWGPVTILENINGKFKDVTANMGLSNFKGWWNGVATGDFNEDGLLDIVATNWGVNTKYHFSPAHPRKVYFDDFDNDNILDIVEAHYDDQFNDLVPERGFSCISNAMPFVGEEKETFLNYAQSSLSDIFGNSLISAPYLEANTLESMVFINNGNGFDPIALPFEAQIS
ncbi:MAG: VCBS repeat-containing protein, partial [Candidatus Marinimicrobia bacterium]|nr:VCBS repeat-containing protein [Candidatus Neomarinimicrobiota bacterium]